MNVEPCVSVCIFVGKRIMGQIFLSGARAAAAPFEARHFVSC